MQPPITVTPEAKSPPNLRKLARALIALARRTETAEEKEANSDSHKPPGGPA